MWIMSQHGFYSIVQRAEAPETVQVRARLRQDLENLRRVVGLTDDILTTPHNDYPFRLLLSQPQVLTVLARLGETIDYSNFKSRVHELPDQAEKGSAYMKVWSAMRGVEKPEGRR